jgi:transposase InsO family protein
VSKKTYYRSTSPTERLERRYHHLKEKIEAVVEKHGSYGYRRIQVALRKEHGEVVNHKVLRKLLRLWGLGLPRKIRKPKPGIVQRVLDFLGRRANLLYRVTAKRAMQVLVSDITEISYGGGTAYLCVHLDHMAKHVYGWKLAVTADASIAVESFHAAVGRIRQ